MPTATPTVIDGTRVRAGTDGDAARTVRPVRTPGGHDESDLHTPFLAASLVHDLRTPLAVIRTALEVLTERGAGADPDATAELLELATTSALRIARMAEEVERPSESRAAVPFGDLVGAAVREVRIATGRDIDVFITPGAPRVPDADAHLRVLVNLLDNAVKFSPPTTRVHVLATHHGHEVVVEVADEGCGIPPEAVERVFRAGVRLVDADLPGRGLGLAIVRALVERLGGALSVDSEPGRGTCISYVAPAAAAVRRRQSRGSGA